MKKTINKKMYVAPVTELLDNFCQPFMINIGSGETTPEESDANVNFFNEEEEDYGTHSVNIWDDL